MADLVLTMRQVMAGLIAIIAALILMHPDGILVALHDALEESFAGASPGAQETVAEMLVTLVSVVLWIGSIAGLAWWVKSGGAGILDK